MRRAVLKNGEKIHVICLNYIRYPIHIEVKYFLPRGTHFYSMMEQKYNFLAAAAAAVLQCRLPHAESNDKISK